MPKRRAGHHEVELVDINGVVKHQTALAFLFWNGEKSCWLPKSQVEWHSDDNIMVMPEWLASEKGLI